MQNNVMGYNQSIAIKNNLDVIDLTILQWFHNFKSKKELVINEVTYYWLNYKTVIEDLPILKIKSKDVLRRRLKKMVEKKILIHKHVKIGGRFSYYAFGTAYQELLIDKQKTPEEPNEQTKTEKPESNSNQTPEQPNKQTDTYNTPSEQKPTKNIPKTNENQTLIETQTKLKLTAKEAQIVLKWGDVDKLKRAIKIYNNKNGKKFFGYLKAIYEKGAIDFSSMDKPRTQVTETAKEVAITTDDNVIVLSNREMVVGTETVTQLEFDLGEDVTEQVLDLIKKEQMVSPIAYDTWFKKSSFKRIANGLHITTSESGLEILKTRYTEVLEIVLKILEDGG